MATFRQGDYEYTIINNTKTVGAKVVATNKPKYQDIPQKVAYNNIVYTVVGLNQCFNNCGNLLVAPSIPNTIQDMSGAFLSCDKLTTAPVIFNNVKNLTDCFKDCTKLTGDIYVFTNVVNNLYRCFLGTTQPIVLHSMNNNYPICQGMAQTSPNGNICVNITPETPTTFIDAEMNYKQDNGMQPISLETNANLVQCEVEDSINGGIKTTNVNDALIDLYKRGAL